MNTLTEERPNIAIYKSIRINQDGTKSIAVFSSEYLPLTDLYYDVFELE